MTNPQVLDAVKAEILELEEKRYQAIIDGNLEAFRACCHPDLVYTHSNGSRDSVDSYLDKVRSGFYAYHDINHPADAVLVVGDTAVVIGEMNANITAGGADKQLANNSIAVWIKQNGTWLLLAYQPTPRPQAA